MKLAFYVWKKIGPGTGQKVLILKYDGSFKKTHRVGQVAYRLKLLNLLKIHPTIYMGFLEPYREDLNPGESKKN